MPSVYELLKKNLAYVFVAAGVVWLALSALTGSLLLLWPVLAFVVSGVLLKVQPDAKLTGAWASASAVMGVAICGWQAATAAPMVTGAFATLAAASTVGFLVFAVAQLVILAAAFGAGRPK